MTREQTGRETDEVEQMRILLKAETDFPDEAPRVHEIEQAHRLDLSAGRRGKPHGDLRRPQGGPESRREPRANKGSRGITRKRRTPAGTGGMLWECSREAERCMRG
jgi:hypothetical protein